VAISIWIRKFRNLINQHPFLIVQDLLNKIPGRPFQVSRFFLLSLSETSVQAMRGYGAVRPGTLADVPGMCMLENKKELFTRRFMEGESCVVAVYDGTILGYIWFSDKPWHREERFDYFIEIPEDSLYSFDCFIKYEYRLRGIWVLFQKHLLEQVRKVARKKVITLVDFGNDPSLKAHLRFGYVLTRRVSWAKLFFRNYFRERDCLPESSPQQKPGTP